MAAKEVVIGIDWEQRSHVYLFYKGWPSSNRK